MRLTFYAATMLLLFSACQKDLLVKEDSVNAENVSNNATPASEFATCKLRRIVHDHGGAPGVLVNGLFTYNPAGNPVSLTYGNGTGTGNPNYYFFYDKQNRLRELRIGYTPTDPVEATWHRYGYNSDGVLIVDTTLAPGFTHGEEGEEVVIPDYIVSISTLTYDAQGRIIKETIKNFSQGTTRYPTYTYDVRGNLGVTGWKSSSYDYKVSIFRSHPVFQFIHRNYSKNNAAPQAKYNSMGLPLSMYPANDAFFNAYPSDIGGFKGGISKAIYDCQ